jgi:beta-galactosidase
MDLDRRDTSWTFDVAAGSPLHVEAYAAADDVEFRLNGATVAVVRVGADRRFVAEAGIPYEQGILEAVAFRAGEEVGRCSLRTAGEPTQLLLRSDRTRLPADSQRLAHIELALVDAHGVLNPIRDRQITIDVGGPGIIQGFGTAEPATEESFLDNCSTSYQGRALAVVRATGEPGQITITARANGVPDAVLRIDAA